MHDLVIRNGKIVDGTGAAAFSGDVAIDRGVITSVGGKAGAAKREIDANGLIVTPGWVDIHTHYDGQAAWDPYLSPSSWHGVTTVVIGNCGVGFAPVRPGKAEYLIGLMDAVEDIPTETLRAGIDFRWETFGQYLDALSSMKRIIDVGTHVPHCAVRTYAMGERGAANEEATADDIAQMAASFREGLKAGALGISTSRTILHRTREKGYVPGTFAGIDEVMGIGRVLGEVPHAVYEIISDLTGVDADLEWMARISEETGRPVSLGAVINKRSGMRMGGVLDFIRRRNATGAQMVAQVAARPAASLMSLQSSVHPFSTHRSFRRIMAGLSFDERVAKMRDPQVRAEILADTPAVKEEQTLRMVADFQNHFPLGDPPNYEPTADQSILAIAKRAGKSPQEIAYDILLERNGRAIIYNPLAYKNFSFDSVRPQLTDTSTVLSLSDGGAHCGVICDASMPTYLLTHWVRDRDHDRIPLETAVKRQTLDTARLYGLNDRGVLAPGMKADVNLIELDRLRLHEPEMVFDLPANGRRFIQKVDGYRCTITTGELTYQDGEPTGAMPGKVIRGAQAPATR
ncbi:MAG TPA: amidohydrolase family protein [Candidatus Binataceae bacterium]|nr:amidohydrolase family protein [Candidatus Binataceae bacterium]